MDTHREGADTERARLQLQLLTAILDRYREPVFVIDASRQILFRNYIAERVLSARGGLFASGGRLQLGSAKADATLRAIVSAPSPSSSKLAILQGIRVPRTHSPQDWLILVRPLLDRTVVDAAPLYLVQAIGRCRPRAIKLPAMQELFGLTAKEVAVASELMHTGNLALAAVNLTLSRETIRSHLKRIFRKCDVHSKSELLLLLHWIVEFPEFSAARGRALNPKV